MKKAKGLPQKRGEGALEPGGREAASCPPSPGWCLPPVSGGAQGWEKVPRATSGLLLWTKRPSSTPDSARKETLPLQEGPRKSPCSPGEAHSHPNQSSCPDCPPRHKVGAGSHLPAQGPGKGVRTANQDSSHLGPSAPTPELLQSPLTESFPSANSPHFYQSVISKMPF